MCSLSIDQWILFLILRVRHNDENPGGGGHSHWRQYTYTCSRTARVPFWPISVPQRVRFSSNMPLKVDADRISQISYLPDTKYPRQKNWLDLESTWFNSADQNEVPDKNKSLGDSICVYLKGRVLNTRCVPERVWFSKWLCQGECRMHKIALNWPNFTNNLPTIVPINHLWTTVVP